MLKPKLHLKVFLLLTIIILCFSQIAWAYQVTYCPIYEQAANSLVCWAKCASMIISTFFEDTTDRTDLIDPNHGYGSINDTKDAVSQYTGMDGTVIPNYMHAGGTISENAIQNNIVCQYPIACDISIGATQYHQILVYACEGDPIIYPDDFYVGYIDPLSNPNNPNPHYVLYNTFVNKFSIGKWARTLFYGSES